MSGKNNIVSISEQTGYSASTVSRVLSGKAAQYRISQAAVDIITKEAERCHYRPNLVAQSLRTQTTKTIGLLIPGIENPFFSNLAAIVISLLDARGYHTLLADSRESEAEEKHELQLFQSRGVDGILCAPASASPAVHEEIARQVPMVLIDRYFRQTTLPYVCTDNYAGSKMATEFLIGKGYRRILAIQGVELSLPNQERVRGFLDSLKGSDAVHNIVGDAFSVENGYRETLKAFKDSPRRYDAIFAFSSTILLGAISALRELSLRVGKDVGVLSFDNNGFLEFLDPAVTCVEQPLREGAEIAVNMLFSIMEARRKGQAEPETLQQQIPPTLVVRGSC